MSGAALVGLMAQHLHHPRDLEGEIDGGAFVSGGQGEYILGFVLGGLWMWRTRHEPWRQEESSLV